MTVGARLVVIRMNTTTQYLFAKQSAGTLHCLSLFDGASEVLATCAVLCDYPWTGVRFFSLFLVSKSYSPRILDHYRNADHHFAPICDHRHEQRKSWFQLFGKANVLVDADTALGSDTWMATVRRPSVRSSIMTYRFFL